MVWNPYLMLLVVTKNLKLRVHDPREAIEWLHLVTHCCTHTSLPSLLSSTQRYVLLQQTETKTENSTADSNTRGRNLGAVIPKWDVPIKVLLSELREPCRKGDVKNMRARGEEDSKTRGRPKPAWARLVWRPKRVHRPGRHSSAPCPLWTCYGF